MALLGSAGSAKDKKGKKGGKGEEDDATRVAASGPAPSVPSAPAPVASQPAADDAEGEAEPGTAPPAREEEDDQAEIAAILEEENVQELAESDRERLTEVDALTAQPRPDDLLLYAVPTCGPYSGMHNFKYRVKLTPGNLKKGKAGKTCLDVFLRSPDVTARERELLKAVPESDMIATLLSNVKVSAPGVQKAQAQAKVAKKKAAQQSKK